MRSRAFPFDHCSIALILLNAIKKPMKAVNFDRIEFLKAMLHAAVNKACDAKFQLI